MKNKNTIIRYWGCLDAENASQAEQKARHEIDRDCKWHGWENYTLSFKKLKDPEFAAFGVVTAKKS